MSHYVVRTLVNYLITLIAWHLIFVIVFVVTVFTGHLLYKLNAGNISRIASDLTMHLWLRWSIGVKRAQKMSKVDLCFSSNKLAKRFWLHFFLLVMTHGTEIVYAM